jgi:hypothetical protein
VLHRDPSVQEVRTKSAREADSGVQTGGGEMTIDVQGLVSAFKDAERVAIISGDVARFGRYREAFMAYLDETIAELDKREYTGEPFKKFNRAADEIYGERSL